MHTYMRSAVTGMVVVGGKKNENLSINRLSAAGFSDIFMPNYEYDLV